jgi:hypothetical protein
VLLPVSIRLKEWAYAGLSFDLIGATFSIFAAGQGTNAWFMIIPVSLAVAAYFFFRKRQAMIVANKARPSNKEQENIWQSSSAQALAS